VQIAPPVALAEEAALSLYMGIEAESRLEIAWGRSDYQDWTAFSRSRLEIFSTCGPIRRDSISPASNTFRLDTEPGLFNLRRVAKLLQFGPSSDAAILARGLLSQYEPLPV